MKISDILLESFSDAKRIFSQEEDEATVKKYLDIFKDLAKRNIIKGTEKDISYWIKQGWSSFKELVDAKSEVQSKSEVKKTKKKDSIIVHEDDKRLVVIPLSEDASCFYGKSTKWCTAATQTPNKFNDYFFKYKMTIFYVLMRNGDKYAAAYSPKANTFEFFNAEDKSITEAEFEKYSGVKTPSLIAWHKENDNIIKKRWKQHITSTPELAFNYAREEIGGRFPEGEEAISKSAHYSFQYAFYVLRDRFPEGEDAISKSAEYSYSYMTSVIKGPWDKGLKAITNDPHISLKYASKIIKGRFPEGEDAIASNPYTAYTYADKIIESPFPKGEDAIATSAQYSYYYTRSRSILNDTPFPKGEDVISKDAEYAYKYAAFVLKGPFPKGEEAISTNVEYAFDYAVNVIKEPFPMAREIIARDEYFSELYYNFLKNNNYEKELRRFKIFMD